MNQKILKKKFQDSIRHIKLFREKKKINNKEFTLISNNCWGGLVSRDLNVSHKSPFVGLFIMTPDFIKLISNFEYYMQQDLKFVDKSKYENVNIQRAESTFPIGMLGDIEIDFQHYKTESEAYEKWNRRKNRMVWDNMYFKLAEKYECTYEHLVQFDNLPYKNKLVFTKNKYDNINSAVYIPDFQLKKEMYHYRRYFDIAHWLNTGEIKLK
ncbi:MAG: DUF1919 domain-containing protein [Desemzia incerta]|uniref:DUF1919 domain-containing protein n=1 Tax=Desemzia incerta TaxID=82801 RepID=UPI003316349F